MFCELACELQGYAGRTLSELESRLALSQPTEARSCPGGAKCLALWEAGPARVFHTQKVGIKYKKPRAHVAVLAEGRPSGAMRREAIDRTRDTTAALSISHLGEDSKACSPRNPNRHLSH